MPSRRTQRASLMAVSTQVVRLCRTDKDIASSVQIAGGLHRPSTGPRGGGAAMARGLVPPAVGGGVLRAL